MQADNDSLDRVAALIVDAAFQVHKALGPGLLESVYETCLVYELEQKGCRVQRQLVVPITYKHLVFDEGLRLDLLVDDSIICELKAVDKENPIWQAQLLSYMKMTGMSLGFLINFNVPVIKSGIRRFVL